MMTIIIGTIVLGAVGLLVGMLLVLASEKFKVEKDEREEQVRNCLPGNNCGACGFAGCDDLANAIVSKGASVNSCPVGGDEAAKKIAEIMGVKSESSVRKVAFVKCAGTCELTEKQYAYYGVHDCVSAANIPGSGDKKCRYGCMGYGSCQKVCEFDAISIISGIAMVDETKCKACGKCVNECPLNLIELVPFDCKHKVACNSNNKGAVLTKECKVGCIGCMLCVKNCDSKAISVTDFLAHIDYDKCTNCGKCAEVCPRKVII